jgi:hypothetical protein
MRLISTGTTINTQRVTSRRAFPRNALDLEYLDRHQQQEGVDAPEHPYRYGRDGRHDVEVQPGQIDP